MPTPAVGSVAPDFTAATDDGSVTLAALRGKTVVLYFYPKDATPGCTIEAQQFGALHPQFSAKNVVVFGVSKDSVKSHQKFRAKECLPFSLISDPGDICDKYGAWRTKKLYGREYEGIARITVVVGPDGKVRHVFDPVKANGHAAEVLAAIGT